MLEPHVYLRLAAHVKRPQVVEISGGLHYGVSHYSNMFSARKTPGVIIIKSVGARNKSAVRKIKANRVHMYNTSFAMNTPKTKCRAALTRGRKLHAGAPEYI